MSVEDGTEGGYTAYPADHPGAYQDYYRRLARTEGTQRYIDSGEYEGEYFMQFNFRGDGSAQLIRVNRVEVIDSTGRAYVEMDARDVRLALQDGGYTLKVFLRNEDVE